MRTAFSLMLLRVLASAGAGVLALTPARATDAPKDVPVPEVRESGASRVLVVYFSRADDMPPGADAVTHATPEFGNTRSVALAVAEALKADIKPVRVKCIYPVGHRLNSAEAKKELDADARPELLEPVDVGRYDTVFVGFPVWWYREPMAIRTFVEANTWTGKRVVPFCTSMSVGIEQALEDLRGLCRGARVVVGRRFATGDAKTADEAARWAIETMRFEAP